MPPMVFERLENASLCTDIFMILHAGSRGSVLCTNACTSTVSVSVSVLSLSFFCSSFVLDYCTHRSSHGILGIA